MFYTVMFTLLWSRKYAYPYLFMHGVTMISFYLYCRRHLVGFQLVVAVHVVNVTMSERCSVWNCSSRVTRSEKTSVVCQ